VPLAIDSVRGSRLAGHMASSSKTLAWRQACGIQPTRGGKRRSRSNQELHLTGAASPLYNVHGAQRHRQVSSVVSAAANDLGAAPNPHIATDDGGRASLNYGRKGVQGSIHQYLNKGNTTCLLVVKTRGRLKPLCRR
jgi:hypothetical protein